MDNFNYVDTDSGHTEETREFVERVRNSITRPGIHDLLEYLMNETDFFYAPCSTMYHLCVPGGLVTHSLRVHDYFNELCNLYYPDFSAESRTICALFHDLCKYHCYNPCKRSRKTGEYWPNGKPVWEDYDAYEFVEEFPFGHGEKSVYLLSRYLDLTDEEALAIRWHMGMYDNAAKSDARTLNNAIEKYPVITLLHCADLIATSKGY